MKKLLLPIFLLGLVSCTQYTKEDFLTEQDNYECLSNYHAIVENEYTEVDSTVDMFINRNTKYRLVRRHYDLPYISRIKSYNVDLQDIVELERTRRVKVIGVYPICKNWALLYFIRLR